MATARIGISGWNYAPWRGVFFPEGLVQSRELEFASRQVDSIEINGSFYALQKPASYARWYRQAPDGFVYSVKAPRYISHIRRLNEVSGPVSNFFASGVLGLREKLGPILWQFPPSMKFDYERFSRFIDMLPHDTIAAARSARKHDAWMAERALTFTDERRPVLHCIEVRNETFRSEKFFELLKDHGIANVISHSTDAWPQFDEVTSDFVYARLHGEGEIYSGSYGRRIVYWQKRVETWLQAKRDVYLYFDNDQKVRAPFDAMKLMARVHGAQTAFQKTA